MSRFDYEISVLAFIATLAAAHWLAPIIALALVICATLNLLHYRQTLFTSGGEFVRRVQQVLTSDIAGHIDRIEKMERSVVDIKEAQMKIGGAFRGRNLP